MGEAKRQTPQAMPSDSTVRDIAQTLQTPFLMAGSRGNERSQNKSPDFEVHGRFRVRGGDLAIVQNKQVLVFTHGYNVNMREAVTQTKAFFRQLELSIDRDPDLNADDFAFLGFSGPQSMKPLKSLRNRIREVTDGKHDFRFQMHDFSPSSPLIMNPRVWARAHSDYWSRSEQTDYYVNFIP